MNRARLIKHARVVALVFAAFMISYVAFCPNAFAQTTLTNDDVERVMQAPDSVDIKRGRPLTALDFFMHDLDATSIVYYLIHRADGTIDVRLLDPIPRDAVVVCKVASIHGDVPIENVLVGEKSFGCHD
jgi:hypothetical protein